MDQILRIEQKLYCKSFLTSTIDTVLTFSQ